MVLAALAIALVIAISRDGGSTISADPSVPSSVPPLPSSAPGPSETPPSSGPSAGAHRTDELLAAVPADFTDCEPGDLVGDGDVAAATCGPSATRPGSRTAAFCLYEDAETLDRVFAEESSEVGAMPEGKTCATAQGVTTWEAAGVEGGCIITEDGVLLAWSDRPFGIEGVLTAPGSTQEEPAALAQWWATHSDYRT